MDEINGVLARKWNMERVTCFISMDLHTSSDIKGAANVKRRTKQRLVEWNEGKFDMLGSSTIICAEAQMSRKQNGLNEKKRAKFFSRMICRGKIRAAIRYVSEREKGGILMPGDTDEKTGDLIKVTLAAKHPEARDVDVADLPDFDSCPTLIDNVVIVESVERVAKKLSGSAGPSGVDSIAMSHWLLQFGGASASLRKSIAKLVG